MSHRNRLPAWVRVAVWVSACVLVVGVASAVAVEQLRIASHDRLAMADEAELWKVAEQARVDAAWKIEMEQWAREFARISSEYQRERDAAIEAGNPIPPMPDVPPEPKRPEIGSWQWPGWSQ